MATLLAPEPGVVQTRPLRVVGLVWLGAILLRPVGRLAAVIVDPNLQSVLSGWPAVVTAVLTLVAAVASLWWGAVLGVARRRWLAVGSVLVMVAVTAAWGFALAAAWRGRGAEVNPEAAWALFGLTMGLTLICGGAAILAGYLFGPRIIAGTRPTGAR